METAGTLLFVVATLGFLAGFVWFVVWMVLAIVKRRLNWRLYFRWSRETTPIAVTMIVFALLGGVGLALEEISSNGPEEAPPAATALPAAPITPTPTFEQQREKVVLFLRQLNQVGNSFEDSLEAANFGGRLASGDPAQIGAAVATYLELLDGVLRRVRELAPPPEVPDLAELRSAVLSVSQKAQQGYLKAVQSAVQAGSTTGFLPAFLQQLEQLGADPDMERLTKRIESLEQSLLARFNIPDREVDYRRPSSASVDAPVPGATPKSAPPTSPSKEVARRELDNLVRLGQVEVPRNQLGLKAYLDQVGPVLNRIDSDPTVLMAFKELLEEVLGKPFAIEGSAAGNGFTAAKLALARPLLAPLPFSAGPLGCSPTDPAYDPFAESQAWRFLKCFLDGLIDAIVPGSELLNAADPALATGIAKFTLRTQVAHRCHTTLADFEACDRGADPVMNKFNQGDYAGAFRAAQVRALAPPPTAMPTPRPAPTPTPRSVAAPAPTPTPTPRRPTANIYNVILTFAIEERMRCCAPRFGQSSEAKLTTTVTLSDIRVPVKFDHSGSTERAAAPFQYSCSQDNAGRREQASFGGTLQGYALGLDYRAPGRLGPGSEEGIQFIYPGGPSYTYFAQVCPLSNAPDGLAKRVLEHALLELPDFLGSGYLGKRLLKLTGETVPLSGQRVESGGSTIYDYSGTLQLVLVRSE